MPTYVPAKRATAFRFWVALVDQASTKKLKANPTLAAGDVKVVKDGGAAANITTLPSAAPAAGVYIQVDLSATEMTADNICVAFIDAAGAEWCDLFINLQTVARQVDDLAFPNTSGRGIDVSAGGDVDAAVVSVGSGAINAAAIASDLNIYEARLTFSDDNANTTDRYEAIWYKNGIPLTSGITSPTIQVIKASDGSDLVGSTAMTQIGSTGQYKYTEGTNRVSDGATYTVVLQATIDSATRESRISVARDSS